VLHSTITRDSIVDFVQVLESLVFSQIFAENALSATFENERKISSLQRQIQQLHGKISNFNLNVRNADMKSAELSFVAAHAQIAQVVRNIEGVAEAFGRVDLKI